MSRSLTGWDTNEIAAKLQYARVAECGKSDCATFTVPKIPPSYAVDKDQLARHSYIMSAIDLSKTPIHLGLGARADVLPLFDGSMEWYQRYSEEYLKEDGKEGRLVGVHRFSNDWSTWEMHPKGAEVVFVISGRMTLVQEIDGQEKVAELAAGEAAINPPGVWHTARVNEETKVLFITAGEDTKNEAR